MLKLWCGRNCLTSLRPMTAIATTMATRLMMNTMKTCEMDWHSSMMTIKTNATSMMAMPQTMRKNWMMRIERHRRPLYRADDPTRSMPRMQSHVVDDVDDDDDGGEDDDGDDVAGDAVYHS